jgi:hypothetical protein
VNDQESNPLGFNELIGGTTPTLIFGTVTMETDEVIPVVNKKSGKVTRKRVRSSKTTRVYTKIQSNKKIGGSK